jgi:hypothetical protein
VFGVGGSARLQLSRQTTQIPQPQSPDVIVTVGTNPLGDTAHITLAPPPLLSPTSSPSLLLHTESKTTNPSWNRVTRWSLSRICVCSSLTNLSNLTPSCTKRGKKTPTSRHLPSPLYTRGRTGPAEQPLPPPPLLFSSSRSPNSHLSFRGPRRAIRRLPEGALPPRTQRERASTNQPARVLLR